MAEPVFFISARQAFRQPFYPLLIPLDYRDPNGRSILDGRGWLYRPAAVDFSSYSFKNQYSEVDLPMNIAVMREVVCSLEEMLYTAGAATRLTEPALAGSSLFDPVGATLSWFANSSPRRTNLAGSQ